MDRLGDWYWPRWLVRRGSARARADQLESQRERWEVQRASQPSSRRDCEVAGHVGAAAGSDPVRVDLEVNERDGEELVAERDRQVLV